MSDNNVNNIHSDDYVDIKPLYESGYGNSRVFTARSNGRKVIIKALKEQYANDPRCRAKLHEEYDITSLLDHKFIRKAIDFTSIEGLGDCIVFEYIEGKSLAEHVRVGTLSEKQVKTVLVDVCDALSYMHRNQVVHCNLKPENIMFGEYGSVFVMDWGIARRIGEQQEQLDGTPRYMPPEVFEHYRREIGGDIYALGMILALLWAFREQIRYNPYSYNTIFYMGFALFALSVMITHIVLALRMAASPESFSGNEFLQSLLGSAKMYMLVSAPFLLAFSIALCISNISLIRHEGKRMVNLLGILLSFLLVVGQAFLFRFDFYVSGSEREVMIHDLFANLFAAVYLYFECMLLGVIVADAIAACHEPEKDKDFLIILGCGLKKDGTPTPLLKGRIDRALAFYERQKAETGKELIFVTSGGRGPDEVISESESMKRYLMEQGIPEERIIQEDRSTDTMENMKFSKEKIWALDPKAKVAFSTTNYHVFRSGLFARRVKMRAVGMGAETKWYFWPNAAVREFAGLLTRHRGKQALILGSMIASYVVLTLLAYR